MAAAQEHAAACTCAPDARTLQVLAEAGERQVAAARASCTGVGRGVGGSPPLWGAAHSPAHGSGAGQEHGDFTEGSAQGCVPVALSDSMVDMQQQQHPQPQQHQEHELEQEHAAVDIRHPQAHSLGAKRSSDTGGVHRGGARVWGSGMVADPLDIEGGARLLWLAAEVRPGWGWVPPVFTPAWTHVRAHVCVCVSMHLRVHACTLGSELAKMFRALLPL